MYACRKFVWSGLRHIFLDAVCIVVEALIGIDERLDKALLSTTLACFLMGLVCLGKPQKDVSNCNFQYRVTNTNAPARVPAMFSRVARVPC